MANVPEGLGNLATIKKRFANAAKRRELWRSILQQMYEIAIPNRETFNFHSPGQKKNRTIYDSTAVRGVPKFVSRLMGAQTPRNVQWMDFVAGTEIPQDDKEKVNNDLEKIRDIFFQHLDESDFHQQASQSHGDMSISTGALLFEEGNVEAGEPLFKFTAIPLSQLYLEPTSMSRIQTWFRKYEVPAQEIETLYPEADIPNELKKIIDNSPATEQEITDGVLFNFKDQKAHQVVWWKDDILFTQVFETNPGIIYRWTVVSGETYGRGPVDAIMADALSANKVKEYILKNGAMQVAGLYTAVDDGIFNPYTAKIIPGTILTVGSNSSQNPTLRPLELSGSLQLGDLILSDLQDNINSQLFADPLGDPSDPVKSATEQRIRLQELLKQSGASFARLDSEFSIPLIKRGIQILQSRGLLPEIKIDGKSVAIKMQSPLAKAEAQEDVNNALLWIDAMSRIPPESAALGANMDAVPQYLAEKLSLPERFAKSEQEIKDIKKNLEAQVQAQAQQEGGAPVGPGQ